MDEAHFNNMVAECHDGSAADFHGGVHYQVFDGRDGRREGCRCKEGLRDDVAFLVGGLVLFESNISLNFCTTIRRKDIAKLPKRYGTQMTMPPPS